jgi:uncharacterized membrane protein
MEIQMASIISLDRLRFALRRVRERLWVKPLAVCLLSILAAFVAKLADGTALVELVPELSPESVESLLSIMASSMLVIATFSVASMVSAYASASSTVTPRSFTLVIADDASQNALSTFIGAFIFSIVALTATKNGYFDKAGLFTLFVLTVTVFGVVIITFVGWVDGIARLGRLGSTIDKVEQATAKAMQRRRDAPTLGCAPVRPQASGRAVFAASVGYVQHINIAALQTWAEQAQVRVVVAALPGTFAAPDRALAFVCPSPGDQTEFDCKAVAESFQIGGDRLFDDDPRFGLVVLSEIAGRALSPAVNDPGTAIDVVGTLLRLFSLWSEPAPAGDDHGLKFDRVEVPEVSVRDMFDDAFTAIARDGASSVEVAVRLQKALHSLASTGDANMRAAAEYHGRLALKRAVIALALAEDLATVQDAAKFAPSASLLENQDATSSERD